MRKVLLSTLAACLLSVGAQSPSQADAGEMAKAVFKFPITVTSFAAGTAIGTPIAMGRKSMTSSKEYADKWGEGGFVKKTGGTMVAYPAGMMRGTCEGAVLGPKNAWKNSSEHPFSKDCFSLGDLD
ncbi:MAG: hypothetical protein SGJ27_18515 [Candidatus Melainabacteria bacterium]|nr:hypothetical protein [Candidatus Melainabacteria bacterium]